MNINRRERLWHGGIGFKGRNSLGVEAPRARIPRVAPPLFLGRGVNTAVADCEHLGGINSQRVVGKSGVAILGLVAGSLWDKTRSKSAPSAQRPKTKPNPCSGTNFPEKPEI